MTPSTIAMTPTMGMKAARPQHRAAIASPMVPVGRPDSGAYGGGMSGGGRAETSVALGDGAGAAGALAAGAGGTGASCAGASWGTSWGTGTVS